MVKILKTVDWEDCKDVLLRFAKDKSDMPVLSLPTNFCDFFVTYSPLMHQGMLKEIAKRLMTEPFNDVTATAVKDENSTLFIHENGDEALALNIVVQHLVSDDCVQSWRYLDYQKNAVAKFCHAAGMDKAYLFCASHRGASVLHFVDVQGLLIAVPVMFVTDLTMFQKLTNRDLIHLKHGYLRDYLPRETGDLLSKKRHRTPDEAPISAFSGSGIDKGDML